MRLAPKWVAGFPSLLALIFVWGGCAGSEAGSDLPDLLDAPVVEHRESQRPAMDGFSSRPSVVLFPNGTAIAVDARLNEVRLIDPEGRDRPVGRAGSGPGEFRQARAVVPWAGDTAAVYDRGGERLLLVTSDGATDQTVGLPPEGVFWGARRAADGNRNVYYSHGDAREAEHPDYVPVIRWNASTENVDTVALVRAPGVVTATRETTPGTLVNLVVPQPFDPRDLWAVAATADVAILRCCDTVRLEWVTNGEERAGPAYSPPAGARLTDADREPYEAMDYLDHTWNWPQRRPPIAGDGLVVGTDQSVWARLTLEDDHVTRYAEFTFDGRIRAIHQFAGRRYVVAVGRSRIYAVEHDVMDLYHLEMFHRR
jgi:hypothetical protein